MKKQNDYSDEYISAYIDGELDNEERTRLLFAEQKDELLVKRINEARMLKEKVQLAYMEFSNDSFQHRPSKCPLFVRRHRSFVAGVVLIIGLAALLLPNVYMNDDLSRANEMMESTPPLAEKSLADAVGVHSHVLIHVSQFEANKFGPVIDEIEALLQQHEADKSLSVEIVANKQA